jgi:hypothetical protein
MNNAHAWIVFVTAIILCTVSQTSADDAGLAKVLGQFPGYHLSKLQERDPEVRTFIKQHFPSDNPSVLRADFDGDGVSDYAILLTNDRTGATKPEILLCSVQSQCRSVY